MTDFNIRLARALVESDEDYPVDFDELWRWCGYSRKNNAKRVLLDNFEKGLDYEVI